MPHKQRGAALIVVMAGMSIILLVLLTGLTMTSFSGQALKRQLTYQSQAMNAASAGLTEALSWYRRQAVQPVVSFNPIVNGSTTPPTNDSDEPTVGIVREYDLNETNKVRARYQVRRTATLDLSQERGKNTNDNGTIWGIESEGIVYVRNDNTRAFDQSPNVILARRTLKTEVQRLQVIPPDTAAVFVSNGSKTSINDGVRVKGGSSYRGLSYKTGTAPNPPTDSVTGNPRIGVAPNGYDVQSVFGLTRQELLATADFTVTSADNLPFPYPAMSLVIIQGDATFGPSRTQQASKRLSGSGILFITGNLTLERNSLSQFSGVIYVEGIVSIEEPTTINGALIAATPTTNAAATYLRLNGGGDKVEINYDNAMLVQLRQQMGQYRFTRTFYMPFADENMGIRR